MASENNLEQGKVTSDKIKSIVVDLFKLFLLQAPENLCKNFWEVEDKSQL